MTAWTFIDKFYATPSDKYRENWDRIFSKEDETKIVRFCPKCNTLMDMKGDSYLCPECDERSD